MRVIELFGGIGAPRAALENLGIDFEVLDYVEIDKYAVQSYNAMYGESYEPQDITEWDKDLYADLVFHGSPCQDFSVIGTKTGGEQGSGTRSSLMWHTVRIVEKMRPKVVIWENVKGVLGKKHIDTFNKYLHELEKVGYTNYYEVLSAIDYNIPQTRERIFVVSILGEHEQYSFEKGVELTTFLQDLLESDVTDKYNSSDRMINYFTSDHDKFKRSENFKRSVFKHSEKSISGTITTRVGSTAFGPFIVTEDFDVNMPVENMYGKVRKITPREAWRLMGFSDEHFDKASSVCSNTQLYKQAGNSIVVNVLEAVLRPIVRVIK